MVSTREQWKLALEDMSRALLSFAYLNKDCPPLVEDALEHITYLHESIPHPRAVPLEYAKHLLLLKKSILKLCADNKCVSQDILKLTKYENYEITILQSQLYLLAISLISKKRALRELHSMLTYNHVIGCLTSEEYTTMVFNYASVFSTYCDERVSDKVKYMIEFCGIAENKGQLRVPVQRMLEEVLISILIEYDVKYEPGKNFEDYMKLFNCIPQIQPLFIYYDNDSLDVDWKMFFDKFVETLLDPENLTPLLTKPSMVEYTNPMVLGMLDSWIVCRLKLQRDSKSDISHGILSDIFHDILLYTKLYKKFTDDMWAIDKIPANSIWDLVEEFELGEKYRLPSEKLGESIISYIKRMDLSTAVMLISDLLIVTATPGTTRYEVLTSDYTDVALNFYAIYSDTSAQTKAEYQNDMFGYLKDLTTRED